MQCNHRWASGLLLAGLTCVSPAQDVPPDRPSVTPAAMRGVWVEASDLGQHHCLQYRLRRSGELVPGTLVIADRQIAEARQGVQEDVLFLTAVNSLADGAWQVTGLLDVYPYDGLKALVTYGFTVRGNTLYRSGTQTAGDQAFMQTQAYERCL